MIHIQDVNYCYGWFPRRAIPVLSGLRLHVRRGESLGIVGPNGAGKSSVFSLLLGYARPVSGRLTIGGTSPSQYVARMGIGYLPEVARLPGRLRVREVLRRLGTLDGLSGAELRRRMDATTDRVGLRAHFDAPVGSLSRGSRQRLGIAQLLLRPRELILLDEPFSGLDPVWRARFREIIAELRGAVASLTVVVASHEMNEIQRMTDRVSLLHRGCLRRIASPGATGLEKLVAAACAPPTGRP